MPKPKDDGLTEKRPDVPEGFSERGVFTIPGPGVSAVPAPGAPWLYLGAVLRESPRFPAKESCVRLVSISCKNLKCSETL